jgi:hypothetical protein
MPRLSGDALGLAIVAAAGLLALIAAAMVVTILRRLATAFRERLHVLPGARWWRRALHGASFWTRIAVHLAILVVLALYVAFAARLVWRAAIG